MTATVAPEEWLQEMGRRGLDGPREARAFRVAQVFAKWADNEGRHANPGVNTTARNARVTNWSATYAMRQLQEQGWLVRTHAGTRPRGDVDVYELRVPR